MQHCSPAPPNKPVNSATSAASRFRLLDFTPRLLTSSLAWTPCPLRSKLSGFMTFEDQDNFGESSEEISISEERLFVG